MQKHITRIIILLIMGVILFFFFQKPSHDRNWERESKILPSASIEDGRVTIKNVRDFKYSDSAIIAYDYEDRTFELADIQKAYFIIEPFSTWKAVGHTFLTFDIKGQKPISFSVEARREEGESYSATKGLFKKYELWYVWGNETDLIVRRGLYLYHPLHMYPLETKPETARKLFQALIEDTIDIEKNPRFYNTILSNCTNALGKFSNQINKGSIPWHYSFHLTGYSDEYLYKLGLISNDKTFTEKESDSYVTDLVNEKHEDDNFSRLIRDSLK